MSDPLKGLKPTPGLVTVDEYGWCVRAHDGQMNVCDIRGWGWLTGKTAQGRTPDDAEQEQRANALLIADAFNTYHATGLAPSQLAAELRQISSEFDLPPTIRPVEGEITRMRALARESAALRAERDELVKMLKEADSYRRSRGEKFVWGDQFDKLLAAALAHRDREAARIDKEATKP